MGTRKKRGKIIKTFTVHCGGHSCLEAAELDAKTMPQAILAARAIGWATRPSRGTVALQWLCPQCLEKRTELPAPARKALGEL